MPSSSPVLPYVATIALSLCVGYFAGIGSALPISRSPESIEDPDAEPNLELNSDSPTGDGDILGTLKAEPQGEECKLGSPVPLPIFVTSKWHLLSQVLVVRGDLGMSSGKIAAQCSHATLACYKALKRSNPSLLSHWEKTGQTKIALRCEDEEELLLLEAQAQSLNLCARSIQDAGRTQIAAGSRTVVGIGPGPVRLVNQVTGKLKLL